MSLTPSRKAVVDFAYECLNHNVFSSYGMVRPIRLDRIKALESTITDCSGAAIGIYYGAGVPDPSGNRYSGQGNTDSFYSHLEHINYTTCQPADLIDVTRYSDKSTEHVYLVLEKLADGDFKVFSNGGPGAAKVELLSAVHAYWYNLGYYFQGLRELAISTVSVDKWLILNGRGERITTKATEHPSKWAANHPAAFRKYGQVRFKHIQG